jgi:hypothetical protein
MGRPGTPPRFERERLDSHGPAPEPDDGPPGQDAKAILTPEPAWGDLEAHRVVDRIPARRRRLLATRW